MAFYVCGLPGLLLAMIVKLTLREPPRGFSEGTAKVVDPPPFLGVLQRLWAKKSFRHLSFAAGLHAFVSYGVGTFYSSYLVRTHAMTIVEVSKWLSLSVAVGGFIGTYYAARSCATRQEPDPRYYCGCRRSRWCSRPFGLVVFGMDNKQIVLWTMIPMIALSAAYLAPSIATTHRLVGLRERAVAGAVLLFVLNLIGLGLGPMFTGFLSDAFNARFVAQGMAKEQASADGLQWALCIATTINLCPRSRLPRDQRQRLHRAGRSRARRRPPYSESRFYSGAEPATSGVFVPSRHGSSHRIAHRDAERGLRRPHVTRRAWRIRRRSACRSSCDLRCRSPRTAKNDAAVDDDESARADASGCAVGIIRREPSQLHVPAWLLMLLLRLRLRRRARA